MANTFTLQVRVDQEVLDMVDDLTTFYGKQAADLGLAFGRTDCIRVVIRAAHRDMTDQLAGRA